MPFFHVLVGFLCLTLVGACSYSRDCDDFDPSTPDVCIADQHICINIGGYGDDFTEVTASRNLSQVVAETNALPLSAEQKRQIISTVIHVYGNLNPHLFLHRNVLGVDIISELQKLRRTVEGSMTNFEFHLRMIQVFQMMNDGHSKYATAPLKSVFAWLGFFVREVYEGNVGGTRQPKYIVSDVIKEVLPAGVKISLGSEVVSYNGVRIREAINSLGRGGYGSNGAARLQDGISKLTYRDTTGVYFPLKKLVTIGFRDHTGSTSEMQLPWMYEEITDFNLFKVLTRTASDKASNSSDKFSLWGGKKSSRTLGLSPNLRQGRRGIQVLNFLPSMLGAEEIRTKKGPIGRLRVSSFQVPTFDYYLFEDEINRLLRRMPKNGLIVDLRGNRGGSFALVKVLAELVSPRHVPVQRFSVRATPLALTLFKDFDLSSASSAIKAFIRSVRAALASALAAKEQFTEQTGSLYAEGEDPNRKPVYSGPVITLVDGLTYSAAEAYAALQVDQNRSLLVGTGNSTGGGGALVIQYSGLRQFFSRSVGKKLPGHVDFTTPYARWHRSGEQAGKLVEKVGVTPDIRYYYTRGDVLNGDRDLYEFLAAQLREMDNV